MLDIAENIVLAIRDVVKKNNEIALHTPYFFGKEKEYLIHCIDTSVVSYIGQYVTNFEKMLQEYTGAKYAIATVNGTTALHLSLLGAGISANQEVLMPSFTFVATANAVHYCGAIPHFVDIEKAYLCVCPVKLAEYLNEIAIVKNDGYAYNKKTDRIISALLIMHTFGKPAALPELKDICNKYNIILIEDAAQSLGSFDNNIHTGNCGLVSSLSFNGNKIITTGGGGAVLTNNDEIAQYIRHISTTAKVPRPNRFIHDDIGYNYRMPNVNAAIGCAQMENFDKILELKGLLADKYKERFSCLTDVEFMSDKPNTKSNYWLNTIVLRSSSNVLHDVIRDINQSGVQVRPAWDPMHTLLTYSHCPRSNLANTEEMFNRVINIPSSAHLLS